MFDILSTYTIKGVCILKKGSIIIPLLATSALLGGCGVTSQSNKNNAESSKVVTTQGQQATQQTDRNEQTSDITNNSPSQTQAMWNAAKSQKLAAFMQSWGNTMNQHYKSYGPGNNTNFYGIAVPQQFDQLLLKVNNQEVSMKWSKNGNGSADYNVVAIYCDSDAAQPMNAHLYLFTIHNGRPVVLITQQTNGNVDKASDNGPDDGLHFKETANQDLKNGFNQIVNGKTPQLNNQQNSSNSANSQKDAPDNFPANMQGTWYSYDKSDDKMITMTINGNKMTYSDSPDDTVEVHKITDTEKQANEQAANGQGSIDQNKQQYWVFINSHKDGWLQILGWYWNAGYGSFYKVLSENVNGKNVPVLASANGAGILVNSNYYRSRDLAQQQKDTTYPDENTLNNDNSSNN